MNLLTSFKQRVPYIVTSVAVLVALVAPGFISTYASAAQVTERSIALSSSSADADDVTYTVAFTAVQSAGAFNVEFCNNSPDPSEGCTPATGFSAAGAASTSTGVTGVAINGTKVTVTDSLTASQLVSVDLTGIHNPSVTTPFYARITTYVDAAAALAGTPIRDQGGLAIAITNTIGVSGAVQESLTFCVAGAVIAKDCDHASDTPPILKLGETVGAVQALVPGAVSTGTLYTQISTNAVTGAVVNLKSGNDCGGLKRADVSTCDIAPVGLLDPTGIAAGQARFGVKTGTVSSAVGADANGTIRPVGTYSPTVFALNYVNTKASGVTSPIGDPFLDTNNAPVNNKNMDITFGASVTNSTPAGNYSTSLTMIATGKF